MNKFHNDLCRLILAHNDHKLRVWWTPGYQGIPGNEAADEQAKKAAGGESSTPRELPRSLLTTRSNIKATLPISKSALKQQFREEIKAEVATVMKNSPHYKCLYEIDTTAPSRHFSKLVEKLP
ncbi:hypothetical protein BDR06DRAFT_891954 [Suillus hirtellus]|nr:hypothetical protein BDR06DRAFT_891954 [Suillus hirtellus]